MAVVTPNCAMDDRSQTNSYNTPQNPERKNRRKYQVKREISGGEGLLAMPSVETSVERLLAASKRLFAERLTRRGVLILLNLWPRLIPFMHARAAEDGVRE